MIGVVQALDRCDGLHERGYTFVNAKGPGEDLVLSFHALRREAMRRAAWLEAQGLRKGDRLAMVLPDGPDFVPTFLGALWAGMVPVPLYPPLSLGKLDAFMEALVTILNVAQPRALITDERVAKILWSAIGKVPSIEKVLTARDLAAAPFVDRPHAPIADADVAFLQFTSGSTSTPKGVVVTHGSLAANCNAIVHSGLKASGARGDIGVSWLPLYHDMGLIGFVLTPLVETISIIYIPTLSFIKNATLWLETISRYKATMTFAPNFAYALVTKRAKPDQVARWDLSRMRVFGCGAEPINPDTMRAFLKAMEPAGLKPSALMPCYGMAEATLAMAFVGIDEPLKTDRIDAQAYHAAQRATPATSGELLETVCCGRTFPGHAFSIQDERGRHLPERAVGEICFQGPSVAAGYYNRPEATAESFRDGWLRTGDLGYLAGGELYISGRLKDILIVNGRNYYPQRIEWLVDEIPGVRKGSAVVFTRPGKASEEIIVAAESRNTEGLAGIIKARVAEEFQLSVSEVKLVPPGSLPKTSSGKLQRRKTREQFLDGTLGQGGVRSLGFNGSRMVVAKHLALSLFGRARHSARGFLKRFQKAV